MSKKTVLLVDDDSDFVEQNRTVLEEGGYTVDVAFNGDECRKYVEDKEPDLIVLDVMLPSMDGFQVCQILKHNTLYKDIPIIMLSAKIKKEDINKGLQQGADDYMTKPFDPNQLTDRIKAFISRSSSGQKNVGGNK